MNTKPNYTHADIVIASAGVGGLGKDGKRVPGYAAQITLYTGHEEPAALFHACERTGLHVSAYRSCLEGIVALLRLVRQRFGAIPVAIVTNLSAVVAACAGENKHDAADADLWGELEELLRCDAPTTFNIRSNASEPRLIEAKAIVETVHLHSAAAGLVLRRVSPWQRGEAA